MSSESKSNLTTVNQAIFIGCNRVANCAVWGRNNLVAFGAGKFVGIYSPKDSRVLCTLRAHTDRVNTVSWITNTDSDAKTRWKEPENELISGSSDKTLIVWKKSTDPLDQATSMFLKSYELTGHKDSVTSLSCITEPDGSIFMASASADCSVILWRRKANSQDWTQLQTLSFAPKMIESVSVTYLDIPGNQAQKWAPLIAVGGVDTLVHLYIEANGKIVKLISLQGHEDWIRCLSFARLNNGELMLASSSQDRKIRLWKVSHMNQQENNNSISGMLSNLNLNSGATQTTTISSKGHIFKIHDNKFSVILESLLVGHEDWVHSAKWQPPVDKNGSPDQPLCLLSCSMDKTMMIWRPTKKDANETGLWVNEVHVGELGGNILGFFGSVFSPDGTQILSHGFNGAFHIWKNVSEKQDQEVWAPQVTVSGHFGPVSDIMWDPTFSYLVSVSEDQTTRAFAVWNRQTPQDTWHEISRVQIHGYDLNCLAFVRNHSHRIASGADEKVIRIFDAPQTFIDSLSSISRIPIERIQPDNTARPLGANVPPLGLSNKPLYEGENEQANPAAKKKDDYDTGPAPLPITHSSPPLEEHLLQSTLWPEIVKLYGHPNEIAALASSNKGNLLASACKGSQPEESSLRLWNTTTWKEVAKIGAHKLTAVQLEFSSNDEFLLSVSRDRTFCITKIAQNQDGSVETEIVAKVKAHERIVWCGGWSCDDSMVATGSRDKTIKVWQRAKEDCKEWKTISTITFGAPVTALTWATKPVTTMNNSQYKYLIAVGLENGLIAFINADSPKSPTTWTTFYNFNPLYCHADTVKKLQWRQNEEGQKEQQIQLASCSTDNSVRLFSVQF